MYTQNDALQGFENLALSKPELLKTKGGEIDPPKKVDPAPPIPIPPVGHPRPTGLLGEIL